MELSKELTESLKALSRKEGATFFMTLLAGFQILLHRLTGQDDIVVGAPIAGRNRAEIEGLIGFFVNTLVLRTDVSGSPTFQELLSKTREVALAAYAHQDLPFERLVEELHPERSLNHTPLFQVLFNMINQGASKFKLFGLTTERFSSSDPHSKFDLTLYVRERNHEAQLALVYNTDLFSESWGKCFLQEYRHLLEQIVSAPEKPIRSYSLATAESRPLLPDPSAVLSEPPQELVTTLFTSCVTQVPEQPAVTQGQKTWSYSELAERAETIARRLRAVGFEERDVVALYGHRSFGFIAGMLGILLSGGILLPLNPSLPRERIRLMLREARAKRLLYAGRKWTEDAWLEDFLPEMLFVDPVQGCTVDAESESVQLPEISSEDPAYIFFTSGTTGVPKGVLGSHKGLSHFLNWQRKTFAIGPEDRSAQLTSLSFDVVLRDIFLPLTSGATLCLPESDEIPGADELIGWLNRERISILHTVPTVAQSWLAGMAGQASLSAMRWVFFAGEPLTDSLVRQWRASFSGGGELVNLYGPTETTLAKCFYRVPAHVRPGVQAVGQPLPETQALILGEGNQLCGINELGEIVLRTPFRSLGYINAPEENQKRFLKNPFRDDLQDYVYFTGDRGRYRPDGTVELLGRLDDQVKIRGVRVEPDEVTATLARHPAVISCCVLAKKRGEEQPYLVAYVVVSKQQEGTSAELRSYLMKQLPSAMVPAIFVFLDQLPVASNGKVDRHALPEPDYTRQEQEKTVMAPRNELELQLTKIWEKVLGHRPIGVRDNFFDLGGHSLLAVRLFAQIEKITGKKLPLAALFDAPTIEQLAAIFRHEQWSGLWRSLVAIQPGGSRPPFFCVHAHDGSVLFWRDLARHLGSDQPVYALQAQGLDGRQPPHSQFEEMAAHYVKEMRTLQPEGPYFIGGHCFGGLIAFEIAQQLHAQRESVAFLALFDCYAPRQRRSTGSFLVSRYAYKILRILELAKVYVGNLMLLGPRERFPYIKATSNRALYKLYMRVGYPWASAARTRKAIFNAGTEAARKYDPEIYQGHVTLFRASQLRAGSPRDLQMGWGRLARGGLDVHVVPGYFGQIIREPRVRLLAKQFIACLSKAQGMNGSGPLGRDDQHQDDWSRASLSGTTRGLSY